MLVDMKGCPPLAGWFVAGAVLGQLADGVLFRLWSQAGILLPVGRWLDAHGGEVMVKGWFTLWVNAISWFLAVLVGVLAGRFLKRHIVSCLLAAGIGFAFVPFAVNGYLDSEVPGWSVVAWHLVSVALVVGCGLLIHQQKSPNNSLQATAAARGG